MEWGSGVLGKSGRSLFQEDRTILGNLPDVLPDQFLHSFMVVIQRNGEEKDETWQEGSAVPSKQHAMTRMTPGKRYSTRRPPLTCATPR